MVEKSSSSAWDAFIEGAAIIAGAILLYKIFKGTPEQNIQRCPRCNFPLRSEVGNCPNCNLALKWVE